MHPFVVKYTKARHMFKTEIAQLDMKEKKMSTQQQTIFLCAVFLQRQFAETTSYKVHLSGLSLYM